MGCGKSSLHAGGKEKGTDQQNRKECDNQNGGGDLATHDPVTVTITSSDLSALHTDSQVHNKAQLSEDNSKNSKNSQQHTIMAPAEEVVTILHFNDVYNIEPREQEPVGGAARFVTALRSHKADNPMVLFSGDAFNPSLMSSITKGKQMVPVLNAMNIQCACYGNHDFDFGVDVLTKMANQSNFPWLLTNVYDNFTERPLADGGISKMIEWGGKKFGILGLVEEEWIATLATIDADDITFIDYVTEGRRLARELKEQGADYIIALTHMRWPNDRRLAQNVEEIDIILGGHDHDYNVEQVNGKWVIKSGTDFREFSKIQLHFKGNNNSVDVSIEKCLVDSAIQEDAAIKEVVDKYTAIMGEKMESVIGYMEVELDGRFASIRTKETNLGNFVTDIMLDAVAADIALLNSGTLRSDTVHPRGNFKMKDLCSILPMVDPLVVLKLTGAQVLLALENAVSQYPSLEGRFAQVSGVKFAFDPTRPAGARVDPRYVRVQGRYIQLDQTYRLVTKHYIAEGKDGYDVFKQGEVLVNDEEGPRLSIIVQNHFKSVQIVKGDKVAKTPHRQSIISINRRRSLVKQMTLPDNDDSGVAPMTSPPTSMTDLTKAHPSASEPSLASIKSTDSAGGSSNNLDAPTSGTEMPQRIGSAGTTPHRSRAMLTRRASIQSMEQEHMGGALAPCVDGRIVILDDQTRHDLEQQRLAADTAAMSLIETGESAPNTPVTVMDKPNLITNN